MKIIELKLPIVVYISIVLALAFTSSNSIAIEPGSIVGVWLFEEGKGGVAVDSSANKLDGTIEGKPSWADGVFGKALEFDGTSVRVVVPSIGNMKKESGSIVLWVNPNFSLGDNVSYGQIGIGGYYGNLGVKDEKCHQIFKWGGNNNWFYRVGFDDPNDGVGANQFTSALDIMPKGKWTHTAMTWEKGGESAVYINGSKIGTLSASTKTLTEWKEEKIYIGTSWSDLKHKGLLDEVGLLNIALSEGDIVNIMKNGLDRALSLTAVFPSAKFTTTWADIKAQN
jgi:hypothetical protein